MSNNSQKIRHSPDQHELIRCAIRSDALVAVRYEAIVQVHKGQTHSNYVGRVLGSSQEHVHLRGLPFEAQINEDNKILEGSAQRKSE